MPNRGRVLTVTDADRARLERRARDLGTEARVVKAVRPLSHEHGLSAEG
jgi:hypothetical protein